MVFQVPKKLSLSIQLILVYVGLMSVAAIVGILTTNIMENNHISSTTGILYTQLENNELTILKARINQMLSTTTDSFNQYIKNVQYTATYATNSFTGEYNINNTYPLYNVVESNPVDSIDGLNEDVSFWYQHPYYDGSSNISKHLYNATMLDNSHGSMYKSTNLYAGIYMGFEDGLLYSYPYVDVSAR